MYYIIAIQSYTRRYLQRKKYIRIYNATYTIQCFILHRIDVSILLENIKYLANFSKSNDKVQFLQKKTHTHKKKFKKNIQEKKDIITIYKDTHKKLHDKINTLTEIIAEKNTKHKNLILQHKTLDEKYTHIRHNYDVLHGDFTHLIEQYTHSNEARGSLENVNDSLQVINNTLSVQLNEIYINLLETQENLDKHKHKTIWDILFNKIK